MKNVRELETYGAILIGCGIMAYTLMLASVDAPVWATIEFVMGTLFMVVGVWCVYLAGMEYDYEVMAGKMAPLTDGAHRKWGFTGKVETRSYERLVDALIDFVETGDSLKARFLTGFAACLAADRKSVENRGFGVAVRKVRCHRGEDSTVRVSSVETMHERRYTVDDWRYDTAHCEQTENGQKG